ncbi:ABC transporter permease [Streptomyces sp. RK23]|uniref:ABC transporter permease n=1 Tax=unclassified Streptomyces TaxID=2593676 RepID=UPI001B370AD7|nr:MULTISPECIES: FtsX-like permease family protein [unclassified Streptomyces]MBQ0962983.1 ABC transporter permease [Streptomyces sp. RK74B]MBQ1003124.1 ABC transporter permease [Streptomyces sp. RK23]
MNFVKRAGMSLGARKSKTAALLAIFVVLCTLLLGGFLLQAAAARQEADAQRVIGVDVTVRQKGLTPALADELGASDVVNRYNPRLPVRAAARGLAPLTSDAPQPGGEAGEPDQAPLAVNGVRDAGLLLPFSYGSTKITAGRGIGPEDADRDIALIERRLADRNHLAVGDIVRVLSEDGAHPMPLKVVGIFQDPTQDPSSWTPPHELPGNTLYVPMATAQQLGTGTGTGTVGEAVYRIGSPDRAERLHAEAERVLGESGFDFRVNDKAYQDQVRPIQQVGVFAGLIVQVIALAGALILGLIVTLQIRERRTELGVLLAMGERKWKLIGQHAVEVAAVALPAVAVAALAGQLAGQSAGDALLGPQDDTPSAQHGAPDPGAVAGPTVRVEPGTVGRVAGIGLGISLVSTVVPGIGILRLHPRSIFTDSE